MAGWPLLTYIGGGSKEAIKTTPENGQPAHQTGAGKAPQRRDRGRALWSVKRNVNQSDDFSSSWTRNFKCHSKRTSASSCYICLNATFLSGEDVLLRLVHRGLSCRLRNLITTTVPKLFPTSVSSFTQTTADPEWQPWTVSTSGIQWSPGVTGHAVTPQHAVRQLQTYVLEAGSFFTCSPGALNKTTSGEDRGKARNLLSSWRCNIMISALH